MRRLQALLNLVLVLCVWELPESTIEGTRSCICMIDKSSDTSNCSGLFLDYLPNCVPNNTRSLRLSSNNFRTVLNGTFERLSDLEELYLDKNLIVKLHGDAFLGLSKLTLLSLADNDLRYRDSFGDGVFTPLRNLKSLVLKGNCDSTVYVNCTYPEHAISAVPTLEELHIDGFQNVSLSARFASLQRLRYLSMTQRDSDFLPDGGYCRLFKLDNSTFSALRSTPVEVINLNGCRIETVGPNAFRGLKNLSSLHVIDNRRLCSKDLYNALVGINTTRIRELKFYRWCIDRYNVIKLDGSISQLFESTSLEVLDFSGMWIFYIDPSFIEHLPLSVLSLILRDNSLKSGRFLETVNRLTNLSFADLSYQNTIRSRMLERKSGIVKNMNDMSQAKRASNSWLNRTSDDFTLQLPKNLKTLLMTNIKFDWPVPPAVFSENKLTTIDFSQCQLRGFLGPVIGLNHLETMNVSYNSLSFIQANTFSYMSSLKIFLLRSNQIGINIMHSGNIFSNLSKLEHLDLGKNAIFRLPRKLFKSLSNLRVLLLDGNSLSAIDFTLETLSNLEYLDLSNNAILTITARNLQFFDLLPKLSINLTGNHIPCSCQESDIVRWLSKTQANVSERNELQCAYENKTLIPLGNIGAVLQHLSYNCSSWIVITSSIVGFVVIFLISLLCVVLYRKRWQLRYLYQVSRTTLNPYHPLEEDSVLLETDVYISYDMDFLLAGETTMHDFVTRVVLPNLEAHHFTVRIRENLLPGSHIGREITNCLRSCKKMVVIVTEGFCMDYWNTYEFNMAVMEGIYTKRNIVVPVIIGDLQAVGHTLNSEISSFLRAKLAQNEMINISNKKQFVLERVKVMESIANRLRF